MKFKLRFSIQLSILITALIVAVMSASAWFDIRAQREVFYREIEDRGQLLVNSLEGIIVDPLYYLDVDRLTDILDNVADQEDVIHACVYDPAGQVIADSADHDYPTLTLEDGFSKRVLQTDGTILQFSQAQLDMAKPIAVAGNRLGAIRVSLSLQTVEKKVAAERNERVRLTLAMVIPGFLLSLLLGRSVTRPLRHLVEAAEAVGAGDLERRTGIDREDEIGELATAFDRMTQQLQESRTELEGWSRELEQQVSQRTEELQRRLDELSFLNGVALISVSTLDFNEILKGTIESLRQRLDLEAFGFLIVDEEAGELRLHPTHLGTVPESKELRIAVGEGITGWVAQSGHPLLVPDVTKEPRYIQITPGAQSEICVPLKVGQKVIGVINAESTRLNAFSEDDLRLLSTLAGQLALSLENAQLYERAMWSEERYRDLFENANDLIFTLDRDFNISDINKMGERLTGYTVEEAKSMNISQLLSLKDLKRTRLFLANLLASKPVQQPFETEIVRKDSSKVLCEITSRLIEKGGKPIGVHCIARDVTERKKLQEWLLQSEKLSAIGQMISGVAHELNNPLTTIVGFTELLQIEDLSDQVKQDLQKISQAADRARRIVRNLLTFARQHKPERKYLNINEIIQRTLDLRVYQLKVDNITVTSELDERLPRTMADPYQIQQVFLNLINNAHQAMVADKGNGHLTIRSQRVGDTIQVVIIDDGPGIPEEDVQRIFDPFFTTKEVGEGTGLGLAICYGIVREHEGYIWAESDVGQGTTFIIGLPVKEVDPSPIPIPPEEPGPSAVAAKTVLVVEDESEVSALLVRILEAEGLQVDSASDGKAALEMIEKREYDLIISDLKMPGMSGQQLYNHLQKARPPLVKRILFITGDTISADTRAFLERVDNLYLSKPFQTHQAVTAVQKVLTGNRSQVHE